MPADVKPIGPPVAKPPEPAKQSQAEVDLRKRLSHLPERDVERAVALWKQRGGESGQFGL